MVRYSSERFAISAPGYWAMSIDTSSTAVQQAMACRKPFRSKSIAPPQNSLRKASRFNDARLQAVSSRNIYSEQGFEALMRPSPTQVCQSLMVVSRSEEHTSELQSLMRISYAVFCLKKKKDNQKHHCQMVNTRRQRRRIVQR